MLRRHSRSAAASGAAAAARVRSRAATMASTSSSRRCDDDGRTPAATTSTPSPSSSSSPWRHVVTAFVSFSSSSSSEKSPSFPPAYALVRRSEYVSTYRGLWGAVSGFIEPGDASAAERAATEVEEEIGLARGSLTLECRGRPLKVDEGLGRRFVVHPVRFRYCCPPPRGGGGDDDERRDDGDDKGVGKKKKELSSSSSPPPLLKINWESSEAAWVPEKGFAQRETVPRLLDALRRTMPPTFPSPPGQRLQQQRQRFSRSSAAVSAAVAELVADRARGASQLAGVALRGLGAAAAAAAAAEEAASSSPPSSSPSSSSEKESEEASAAAATAAWELCADWGFALAASRPAMAPLATSVTSALERAAAASGESSGDEKGAAEGSGDGGGGGVASPSLSPPPSPSPSPSPSSSPSTPPFPSPSVAVFAAVARAAAEEEARLAEASKELVSAGLVALRAALSRWRLRHEEEEEEAEEKAEATQRQGQRALRARVEREEQQQQAPVPPRIVAISFSSVVRDALVALIREETQGASQSQLLSSSSRPLSQSSSPPPSRPVLLRICVCEGRPLCEGARLAEELAEEASKAAASLETSPVVEVELCTDAAGPALVREELRSDKGGFATAAVVLGADAVSDSGVVNKVGSRALVEAAAGAAGAVPAFSLAGRSKVAGGGGVAALAAARSGLALACREQQPLEEENAGDELLLLLEGRVRRKAAAAKGTTAPPLKLRNPYFERVPLRLLEASGGGVVVEVAAGGEGERGSGDGKYASPPASSSVTLLTARDVAELAERADERARAAFRMDWL